MPGIINDVLKEVERRLKKNPEIVSWIRECVGDRETKSDPVIRGFNGDPLCKIYALRILAEIVYQNSTHLIDLLCAFDNYMDSNSSLKDPVERTFGFSNSNSIMLLSGRDIETKSLNRCLRIIECNSFASYCLKTPYYGYKQTLNSAEKLRQYALSNPDCLAKLKTSLELFWFGLPEDLPPKSSSPGSDCMTELAEFGLSCEAAGRYYFETTFSKNENMKHCAKPTTFDTLTASINPAFFPSNGASNWGRARRFNEWQASARESIHTTLENLEGFDIKAPLGPSMVMEASSTSLEFFVDVVWSELIDYNHDFERDFLFLVENGIV
ncbi:MAG: hypothetical protein NT002_00670 [candidate division Zixibacteria bacterium]|nr:hypothetical protein [candidate division Zixibacteria bacterium]